MAGASLLALLDDIATVLDDVAVMTKLAAKKTAGVLGDDLALNAQQVAGVRAERELPVVWAVARGSLGNKLVLVPAALAISAFAPWLVTPLLMIGGAWLCYEGFEKLAHRFLQGQGEADAGHAAIERALRDPATDMVAFEREKIRGAIRTDFVLSAEIIVIALGTVQQQPFTRQAAVVAAIALLMTAGVYGFVAALVKLDDAGQYLLVLGGRVRAALGNALLWLAPRVMRLLAVLGTAAMFLVGGGILVHGVPPLAHALHGAGHAAGGIPAVGVVLVGVVPMLANALTGIVAGAFALALTTLSARVRRHFGAH
ncbi:MAG: Inner membrane protein YedI [Pseudomonadales bacterium]|nr:Inner membrane protein YedI [Pseudomonadales bacterium]